MPKPLSSPLAIPSMTTRRELTGALQRQSSYVRLLGALVAGMRAECPIGSVEYDMASRIGVMMTSYVGPAGPAMTPEEATQALETHLEKDPVLLVAGHERLLSIYRYKNGAGYVWMVCTKNSVLMQHNRPILTASRARTLLDAVTLGVPHLEPEPIPKGPPS